MLALRRSIDGRRMWLDLRIFNNILIEVVCQPAKSLISENRVRAERARLKLLGDKELRRLACLKPNRFAFKSRIGNQLADMICSLLNDRVQAFLELSIVFFCQVQTLNCFRHFFHL
jgi:hypothetical protein